MKLYHANENWAGPSGVNCSLCWSNSYGLSWARYVYFSTWIKRYNSRKKWNFITSITLNLVGGSLPGALIVAFLVVGEIIKDWVGQDMLFTFPLWQNMKIAECMNILLKNPRQARRYYSWSFPIDMSYSWNTESSWSIGHSCCWYGMIPSAFTRRLPIDKGNDGFPAKKLTWKLTTDITKQSPEIGTPSACIIPLLFGLAIV